MSKIGRKPIKLEDVKVTINDQEISYTGKHASGSHVLPSALKATVTGQELLLGLNGVSREGNCLWGLHRALLANKIQGAHKPFERQVQVVGLGFKAISKGDKIEFSLGYSHKIDFVLPKNVTFEIDKTGQLLTFKSTDKELLGQTCGQLRFLRPVEPYKGTGIRWTTDVVIRKTGKTKAG